jgi:hypothetical protein
MYDIVPGALGGLLSLQSIVTVLGLFETVLFEEP